MTIESLFRLIARLPKGDLRAYEAAKKVLRQMNLTPEAYEQAHRRMVEIFRL